MCSFIVIIIGSGFIKSKIHISEGEWKQGKKNTQPMQQSLHSSWNWKEKRQFEQFSMQKRLQNSKKDLVHPCTIGKYFEHSSTCGQDFWIACNNRSDIVMSMPCNVLSQHKDNRWFTISLKSVITERWYRNKFERLINFCQI